MTRLSFVLGFTLAFSAFAQQAPQAEAKKSATIEGKVVNSKTGEAVRRANLTLRPMSGPSGGAGMIYSVGGLGGGPAAPYATTTDAEGKFRFDNLEPGTYHLAAERQGFIRQSYGARQNMMTSTPLNVTAGQVLKDIELKMMPHAVITGRVFDEEGEPLARVQIQVMRQRFFQGKQQMMPMGGGMTSDTGEYRIAELAPGRYWVNATYRGRMMMMETTARSADGKPEEDYVPTYHPGSLDQASARVLDVEAGQELPGIDIRMQKARVYRIRGKVVGGTPARGLRLMMMPRERTVFMGFMGGGAMVKEDGTFELGGVLPGAYFLTAMPMQGMMSSLGKVAVDVSKDDVENVTLTLVPGITLTGSIRVSGDVKQLEQTSGKKLSLVAVRVQLMPTEGVAMNTPGASVRDDGSFTLENVAPEKYRITVWNLPQGTWLKSVRAGEQEVLDTGMDLSGGAPGAIQVTLGVGTATVTGSVQDAKQQPVAGSMVMLLADPFKAERNDLMRGATTDQTGRFTLEGIAPGAYRIYAFGGDMDPGRYYDPEFLKQHESKSQKMSLKENGQEQVSLTEIVVDTATGR